MPLKAQDVLVALKLSLLDGWPSSYAALAEELGLSASEAHAAVRRLEEARLVEPTEKRVRRAILRNFLLHGVPYAFAARSGGMTRGIPTAWAAPAFVNEFVSGNQLPPVWPDSESNIQGLAVKPLYPSAPHAAKKDEKLYALLAAVDALRIGRARERAAAEKKIDEMLSGQTNSST
jgi:DNA-binding Lrp family transcriptional regulator